jgi:hypothetical protein
VHHLHVVAAAELADVGHAGAAVRLGRDLLEDRRDHVVGLLGAARHQGGALAGTLLAAADTHTHEVDALGLEHIAAAEGVGVPLVSAVDDEVAGLHVLRQELDGLVHGLAGLHQDDHGARLGDCSDELADLQKEETIDIKR